MLLIHNAIYSANISRVKISRILHFKNLAPFLFSNFYPIGRLVRLSPPHSRKKCQRLLGPLI
jgi:hypothetical protein